MSDCQVHAVETWRCIRIVPFMAGGSFMFVTGALEMRRLQWCVDN